MTTATERAAGVLKTLPVARQELSRAGELLLELSGEPEPCWLRITDAESRRLTLAEDRALPMAERLPELRRERGAVVLAWRPGRRAVLRLQGGVLKGFRRGRLPRALERQNEGVRAARAAGLAVAEVLSVEPELSAFVLRDLGGRDVPVATASAARFAELGAALARFQGVQPAAAVELARHDVRAELDVLDGLAEKARSLCASLPAGWQAAREAVERALAALPPGAFVLAHRDLHDGQLIASDAGLALLDFDLLCLADRALDPANLLAHFELRALQGLATPAGVEACASAFRQGFGAPADGELAARLRAWQAATLARLALVYHLRPPYAHLGSTLAARARSRALEETR